jgi:hypothetical protein
LSELFVAPQLDRLRAFQADVIVIAYQTDVDLKYEYGEVILLGGYADTDIETAATIVIDLHRKAIIHGSKISFRDQAFFWHFGPYPYGGFTLDPPDICNTVGRQAGAAIAEAMPGRAVRALVVVAGEDPYEASRMSIHQSEVGPIVTDLKPMNR